MKIVKCITLLNLIQIKMKVGILLIALFVRSTLVHCDLLELVNPPNANTSCTTDCCKTLAARSAQTYYFYQNTGKFKGGVGEWAVNTMTYSGQGKGYLNPDYQCVVNTGPLPATTYKLGYCVNVMHETTQRPCSFYLQPQKESEMCGRSAFFIHGCQCCTPEDDPQPPAAGCSAGCIVMNFANRKKLRVGDTLIVQHYEPKGEQTQQIIEQIEEEQQLEIQEIAQVISQVIETIIE